MCTEEILFLTQWLASEVRQLQDENKKERKRILIDVLKDSSRTFSLSSIRYDFLQKELVLTAQIC